MSDQVILALSTCPDEARARSLAAALIDERLATCVNRVPGLMSTYVWDGEVRDDREVLLIIKTTAARLPALEARLKELHAYELPELVAIRVDGGNEDYLEWVRRGVEDQGR
jgi:periplasmic divalent cation tolerance protein